MTTMRELRKQKRQNLRNFRERMKESGARELNIWLSAQALEEVNKVIAENGFTKSQAIEAFVLAGKKTNSNSYREQSHCRINSYP